MKYLIIIVAIFFIYGCSNSSADSLSIKKNNPDSLFNNYKNYFIDELWKVYPSWATGVGNHQYDSILIIPNEASRIIELNFCKRNLDSLAKFENIQLSEANQSDLLLMNNFLKSVNWNLTNFKSFEWNPSEYNLGGAVADIINNKKENLNKKVSLVIAKLSSITQYYSAARAAIKNPTKEHTELAISQLNGTQYFFESAICDSIKKSNTAESIKTAQLENIKQVSKEISQFISFLDSILKNTKQFRDFRIGKNVYAEKFRYEIQSALEPNQIYEKALKRKSELLSEMAVISKRLWPKYFSTKPYPESDNKAIKELIGTISKTHVARDKFQSEIERQIPILTAFVKEKNLLYLDPQKPLVVRKEPEWMAGVAGASISAPGPYDKEGDTYYNVGSLAAYTNEEAESYLREYNKYILQILNIHEAIPGHYAQLVYSNQSPSIIKSIFGNGAMIEGWAVYSEKMMLEEGWAKNTVLNGKIEEDEMWLMYNKWHLRVVCNTILDYSIHNLNLSKEKGLDLLMNEAFQEKAEAEGKWKRATLTQVQLCSYFTGFSEIYELRELLKEKQGKSFDLKDFHEKLLSFGSAPVGEIKKMMLK